MAHQNARLVEAGGCDTSGCKAKGMRSKKLRLRRLSDCDRLLRRSLESAVFAAGARERARRAGNHEAARLVILGLLGQHDFTYTYCNITFAVSERLKAAKT